MHLQKTYIQHNKFAVHINVFMVNQFYFVAFAKRNSKEDIFSTRTNFPSVRMCACVYYMHKFSLSQMKL